MNKYQVKLRLLLWLLVAISESSCEKDDGDSVGRLTETDFMVRAANSDLFEIQTGQMAAGKGTLSDVREFALNLVMDHMESNRSLRNLASLKKITLPDSLTEDKRAIRMRLASKTGPEFDKDYVDTQIKAHDEAIRLYEQAARELQDPDIRNYATNTLPNLQAHRDHAAMVKAKTDAL